MKQYTETIKIEVAVSDIANKLLSTFPEDYKHRELLTETIIGSSLVSDKITYLYNALNGYSNEIDFQVGEKVICTEQERRVIVWEQPAIEEGAVVAKPIGKNRKSDKTVAIGECEIVAIDLYRSDKLLVKFMTDKYYNEGQEEKEVWVNHRNCTKIAQAEPDLLQIP